MARKKIVFIIVEGPSDEEALGVILNRLFDNNEIYIEIMHGDITSNLSIKPDCIASAIGNVVKKYAASMHFKQVHFQQVIHLIDMDGVYIPDSSIITNTELSEPFYSLTEIQSANPERIKERNKHKQLKLNRISILKKVWRSIPYQAYYMSCNLDHVLYGKMNSTDRKSVV